MKQLKPGELLSEWNEDRLQVQLSQVLVEINASNQRVTVKRVDGSKVIIDPDGPIEVISKLASN